MSKAPPFVFYGYTDEVELLYAELVAKNGNFWYCFRIFKWCEGAGLDSPNLTSDNFIELLAQERRVELFAEGKKVIWYVRLEILDEVVANKSSSSLNENRVVWPIPQDEINANQELSQEN